MKTIILIFVWVCYPAWCWSQDFEIKLHRALTVGAQQNLAINGVVTREVSDLENGALSNTTKTVLNYHIKGVETIQRIDEMGQPQKVDFLVLTYTVRDDETKQDIEILSKKQVLTYEYVNGNMVFLIDGEEVSEKILSHLRYFFFLPPPGLTIDKIWGVQGRKSVGDSWNADLDLLTKQFSAFGIEVNQDRIVHRMTLKNASIKEDVPSLEIEWNIDVPESRSMESLEHGLKIEAKFHESGTINLPIDHDLKSLQKITEMTFESTIDAGDPNQKTFFRSKTQIETTITPVSIQANPKTKIRNSTISLTEPSYLGSGGLRRSEK
jgi:hypothetical protein